MSSDGLIESLREFFRAYPGPLACAYVYGSQARGTARATSDVDIAVLGSGSGRIPDPGLLDALQRAANRPVDLLVLEFAAPDLVHRVLRDGVLVAERDRAARVRFEVRARNDYFDVLPHLREYRRTERNVGA